MSISVVGILAVVLGIIVCFFGYAQFRLVLALAGLIYGYLLGYALVGPEQQLLAVVLGVVVGILGAIVAYFLWSIAVTVGGAVFGFGLGWWLGETLALAQPVQLVLAVVLAIVGAILFLTVRKSFIMLLTAMNGAGAIIYGVGLLFPALLTQRGNILALIIWLVLAIVGFLTQYRLFGERELVQSRA